ncbi:MAG TPA: CGNR zinc finger domain-containing protein [Pseudonocardiaceae bacterium]
MVSSDDVGWTVGLAGKLGVPEDVALIYEFVNSVDHRSFVYQGHRNVGGDELCTTGGLRTWLSVRGLLPGADGLVVSAADLAAARSLRGELRDAISTHATDTSEPEAETSSRPASSQVERLFAVWVGIDAQGRPSVRPRGDGVRAALSLVLIEAVFAHATGRWQRLKMCLAPDCRWVFFDKSKPRTARWCETEICGNRIKKTNQRARRRERSDGQPQ